MGSNPGTREKPRHTLLTHGFTVKRGFLALLPPTASPRPQSFFTPCSQALDKLHSQTLRNSMPFTPNNPPAPSLYRTQKEIVRNHNLGGSVPSATREHNIPLYTVTKIVISKPFLTDPPPKEDELHLQQHHFSTCSPVTHPAQCTYRNL